jgi:hypothetical protein
MADQSTDLSTTNQPAGTTSIDNGIAYDVAGKPLGPANVGDEQAAPPPPPGFKPVTVNAQVAPPPPPGFRPVVEAQVAPPPGFKPAETKVQPSGVLNLTPPAGKTSISPREGGFESWLQDVQTDVKNGSASTWVGAMLKKMGATGTHSGVSEKAGEFFAGPAEGLPKALEGSVALHKQVYEGLVNSGMDLDKSAAAANKIVEGLFQSAGPVGAVAAPGGEALAVVLPAMVAQTNAQKAAEYMGASPDVAELVGNVTGVVAGGLVHEKLNPVLDRFGVAVNTHTAAEQEYTNRSRNLETARAQAAEVQQRALDAAQKETAGQGTPAATDAARQLANEAAKNVADAQKAFDQAAQRRAAAKIAVEKLGRQITKAADKNKADEYESKASEQKKASDLFQKAVPSRGANRYTPEDEEIARAHMEAAKAGGAKINDLPSAYEAVEGGRQGIEDKIKPYVEKYADEPVTTKPEDSPKIKVAQKLEEMAKLDGNFSNAMDALSEFNLTDPTMSEAQDTLTKLNNYNRASMKGANNWDIYNMIETNPDFAARFFMADELRNAIYNNLEGHGVEGIRAARGETASLINVRDAIGAQIRANRGGTTVRGSGNASAMRGLLGRLTGKAIKGMGIAAGAEAGGIPGAIAGGAIGEAVGQPIEDFIAPRDMTRDEHIEKSMKFKGTNRKPVEIKGTGTPPVIPTEAIPPAVKNGPSSVELTPRENTDLHAELAAHYGESNLEDSSYKELEQNLRDDVAAKNRSGVELDPAEKTLLTKILKADTADRAAAQAAGKPNAEVKIEPVKEKELLAEADKRANEGEPTKLNPTLVSLGRGDESALVSHSPAMKAHAPAAVIPGLPEGVSMEDAHLHEWAHMAIGAVDGLEPVEIRSDIHPKSEKGAGATSVFNGASIRDAAGNIDPEALANQEVQWLTQKMAGPASHEVFKGMTRDEVKASPATRGDFRQSRAIIRELHPDFTASQVEQVVDLAYDRAHEFLTKPHIADRIRANAAVREEGLSQTLHASHGRVSQFAEDIRNAHNEYTGTEPGPDGAGAGEGGEKAEKGEAAGKKTPGEGEDRRGTGTPKSAREAAAARGVAESQVGKIPVPKETTTGKPEIDEAIRAGGGIPGGVQKGFEYVDKATGETRQYPDTAYVHEPTTGTSLNFPVESITPELVKERLAAKRAEYAAAEKGKPEESAVTAVEKLEKHPNEDFHPVKYSYNSDFSNKTAPGMVLPDGRIINAKNAHSDIAEAAGYRTPTGETIEGAVNKFEKNTGAARIVYPEGGDGNIGIEMHTAPTEDQRAIIAHNLRTAAKSGVGDGTLTWDLMGKGGEKGRGLSGYGSIGDFLRAVDDWNKVPEKVTPTGIAESKIEKTPEVAKGADEYNKERGLPAIDAIPKPHNVEFAKRVADAFDAMKHEPNNPEVQKAYQSMADEVRKQWDYATQKMGMKFEPWTKEGQPYANSAEMADDVRNNNHLYFFQGGDIKPESPMAKVDPETGLTSNDMFRAVHDLFGHAAHGFEFGPKGEENAYLVHRQMFPPEAIPALTSETRGQNSWVNFGKHLRDEVGNIPKKGESGYVPPAERPYAENKVGLLPSDLQESQVAKSPKGSSVPLMKNPLEVEGTGEKGRISNIDVAQALNEYSKEKNPVLEPGTEGGKMTARAQRLAEDEAKYQLAQGKTGTEWYTTEMKDHDNSLQGMRPELVGGETLDSVPGHPVKLSLFKAAEAVLSSGQKPYGNFKAAVKAWDAYNETGQFPPMNPATGKSWGPRGVAAYGNALEMINKLVAGKGEKGAADWLMADHPVSELKEYNSGVKGKKTDMRPGAMILGEKRGPFMQNLHGVESAFTADMWVSRTWNRWMGTMEFGKNSFGDDAILSDSPRNGAERGLMKESFEKTANKLGLTTSSLQAVLWYYEQALYRAHGIPKESWSFKDAAARAAKEEGETPEAEQTGFNYGANQGKTAGGIENLGAPKKAGQVGAAQFLNAFKK